MLVAVVIGVATVAGCRRQQSDAPDTLLNNELSVCMKSDQQMLLQVKNGRISLNLEPIDSAAFLSRLTEVFALRPPQRRWVGVQLADSLDRRRIGWLVATIRRAGGVAYSADPRCYPRIGVPPPPRILLPRYGS